MPEQQVFVKKTRLGHLNRVNAIEVIHLFCLCVFIGIETPIIYTE